MTTPGMTQAERITERMKTMPGSRRLLARLTATAIRSPRASCNTTLARTKIAVIRSTLYRTGSLRTFTNVLRVYS
jgi:hypothetical protein